MELLIQVTTMECIKNYEFLFKRQVYKLSDNIYLIKAIAHHQIKLSKNA